MDPDAFKIIYGISSWLAALIGIIGVVAGVAGSWAVLRYKVKRIESDVAGMSDYPGKYVLALHCLEIRKDMSASFGKKIDEVKAQLRDMNEMREQARVDFAAVVTRMEWMLDNAKAK